MNTETERPAKIENHKTIMPAGQTWMEHKEQSCIVLTLMHCGVSDSAALDISAAAVILIIFV